MANTDNAQSAGNLLGRICTELWRYATDTFAPSDLSVMDANDVKSMMARVLGTQQNSSN